MPLWIMPPAEPMIEREPAPEIRIDNIGAIEWIDGYVCVYLYASEVAVEAPDAPAARGVKVKILVSIKNVPAMIGALSYCLAAVSWPEPAVPPREEQPPRGGRPTLVPD